MFVKVEQIDVLSMSNEELRELAKENFVYFIYNSYNYEKKLCGPRALTLPDFEDCWRIRRLSKYINDDKSDTQIEQFQAMVAHETTPSYGYAGVIRMV